METTFGRTVETRFINLNNQKSTDAPLNQNQISNTNCFPSSSTNFNGLNLNSIKNNNLKRQQMRQQQLQHIYLNSYKECNAPVSQFTLHDSTFLRPSMQVTPSSVILTRKKFRHFANVSTNNGYSSDGDYCNTDNVLSNPKQISILDLKSKRLNSTLTHNYGSDYEESGRHLENETNDLLKSLNTRENFINMNEREYDIKLMRYKSIERQHAKYVRDHKNFQEKKKLEQNKIDINSYRYQYLNERLNEQINSRLTDLLSTKPMPKEANNTNPIKNVDALTNYNEKIQYLLNKNSTRLQQRQRFDSFNLNAQSNTITRQERAPFNSNNLNLVNYLTWKNCGNIYPSTNPTTVEPNKTITTPNESSNLEENYSKGNFDRTWLNEASRIHSKSISTPSTPQLYTLPRYSRVNGCIAVNTKTSNNQNKNFLTYEKFNENLQNKELISESGDKLNTENDYIRSNSQVRFQFRPNLENTTRHHLQSNRSKSVSNNPEFTRNQKNLNFSNSQLEVVPLENALQNMNEILKNLTLNFQKKLNENSSEKNSNLSTQNNTDKGLNLDINEIDTKTNDLSLGPENLTSDSSGLLHESSFENCIANLSPTSSKSSSSSSYSNSSKSSNILAVENGLIQVLESQSSRKDICEKTFSQSSSMNSCSSSVSDRSDDAIVLSSSSEARSSTSSSSPILTSSNLPIITLNLSNGSERKSDSFQGKLLLENNTDKKKQTLSFGKKIKQFLSFNANNSKRKVDLTWNSKK